MNENLWGYAPTSGHTPDADLTGYKVEATDGHIGKVDKHSDEVASQYIVVDTGVWIFGKEVLLPAGTIRSINHEDRTVHVDRTKDEIKSAPEFDKEKHLGDPHYRDQLGGHYGSGH
ncbi:PRC-barrel domain-containing protein [Streptomyces sp. NPDC002580]|uniref:PRC-barrel domain-containing protein n=1 Tax=Streptomyces sp. NPDC002580 TaxID=3364653 RepID=UPI00369657F9